MCNHSNSHIMHHNPSIRNIRNPRKLFSAAELFLPARAQTPQNRSQQTRRRATVIHDTEQQGGGSVLPCPAAAASTGTRSVVFVRLQPQKLEKENSLFSPLSLLQLAFEPSSMDCGGIALLCVFFPTVWILFFSLVLLLRYCTIEYNNVMMMAS